jgi:hypothetical protein
VIRNTALLFAAIDAAVAMVAVVRGAAPAAAEPAAAELSEPSPDPV